MLLHIALILGCWSVFSEGAETDVAERADGRRPIWNMGHMVNGIWQIDQFVDLGVNSIEFDINFDKNGKPVYTYHGVPCDCFRSCLNWEYFGEFLTALRHRTTPGDKLYKEKLILFVFDMKTNSLYDNQAYQAGVNMATDIFKYYWNNGQNGGRAYFILSIPNLNHYDLIKGFRETITKKGHPELMEKVGYDFSANDNIPDVEKAYGKVGVTDHVWQSDGITNCIARGLSRVKEAVKERDSGGVINKVYIWTIDKFSSTRDALDAGVDGIMTNYPYVLNDVLKEGAYKNKFRMATYEDNPWVTFKA
uniref:Dermonecrotic toxin LiSicTox-alphaII1 n=1 Tax=Loxosceles intermedia TaxID=58218 RepID=A21_LOXIN|nr:RecName: Full=Dermonecrotic toxin LiSicTox-alphaII1; AltName: Full=Dermonecrotic toxin 4; Short=DT4; AltName: Full=LiRecDT4; AltName: Full=Phospholipase D; AltName: Full=Sphingomyelin phosphodiesterase D 4; Short=SMD 4; Short=SMase D 4; Short=Sphingomyelinase D 4; Flags: Precursor [Loxosceles intermedia]ABD91846.1 dermonecrotic toxin isoform 4 [Loxosceles intermedia]